MGQTYGELWVDDFGAIGYDPPPGDNDSWPDPPNMFDSGAAIQAAIDACPQGGTIRFGKARYYSTITLSNPRAIAIEGAYVMGARCGIVMKAGVPAFRTGASLSMRRMYFKPKGPAFGTPPGDKGIYGIMIGHVVRFDCVEVHGMEGNGFHIEASVNSDPPTNANGSIFTACYAVQNWGRGLFIRGADSNACLFLGFSATDNKRGGIDECSFLGNTYVACHIDSNKNLCPICGGTKVVPATGEVCTRCNSEGLVRCDVRSGYFDDGTENRNNKSLFLSTYIEDSADPESVKIASCTAWIGGQGLNRVAGAGSVLQVEGSGFRSMAFSARSNYPDSKLKARTGSSTGALSEIWRDSTDVSPIYTLANTTPGAVGWRYGMAGLPACEITTAAHASGANKFVVPNGVTLSNRVTLVSMASAPTTGTWKLGDTVRNSQPGPGKPIEWVCTTAGTPGVWTPINILPTS